MTIDLFPRLVTVLLCCFLMTLEGKTCSMYKLTAQGHTMVGCNEDNWRTTSRIWFEQANGPDSYGAAFTGSRMVSPSRCSPQSGMNEAGLVFSRLASVHPEDPSRAEGLPPVQDEVTWLSEILHTCATVAEVQERVEQFDRSFFLGDVFIYVEKSGKYLVVEPYRTILGDDSSYVLSNFCPSITTGDQARKLERYRNGEDFIQLHPVRADLDYCTALSDTMHVCRSRNGDGTLLTSIWDTDQGKVDLYFYHDFEHRVTFDLQEELSKEDHYQDIASLFPENAEFQHLKDYVTPFTHPALRVGLVLLAAVLLVLSFLFILRYLRSHDKDSGFRTAVFVLGNLLLVAYFYVLATEIYVYYFDAPFVHYNSWVISATSYVPFVVALFSVPLLKWMWDAWRSRVSGVIQPVLVTINLVIYLCSMMGFAYWGLYKVI